MKTDNLFAWLIVAVSVLQMFGVVGTNPQATSAHLGLVTGFLAILLLRIEERRKADG